MPFLFRFLTIIALLCATGWGILLALAYGISPTPREMVVPVTLPAIDVTPADKGSPPP